jgi:hypothetical protein
MATKLTPATLKYMGFRAYEGLTPEKAQEVMKVITDEYRYIDSISYGSKGIQDRMRSLSNTNSRLGIPEFDQLADDYSGVFVSLIAIMNKIAAISKDYQDTYVLN